MSVWRDTNGFTRYDGAEGRGRRAFIRTHGLPVRMKYVEQGNWSRIETTPSEDWFTHLCTLGGLEWAQANHKVYHIATINRLNRAMTNVFAIQARQRILDFFNGQEIDGVLLVSWVNPDASVITVDATQGPLTPIMNDLLYPRQNWGGHNHGVTISM